MEELGRLLVSSDPTPPNLPSDGFVAQIRRNCCYIVSAVIITDNKVIIIRFFATIQIIYFDMRDFKTLFFFGGKSTDIIRLYCLFTKIMLATTELYTISRRGKSQICMFKICTFYFSKAGGSYCDTNDPLRTIERALQKRTINCLVSLSVYSSSKIQLVT